jgi:acyl-CoA synthetase (AMP-forming)/AMP-acid ligase II
MAPLAFESPLVLESDPAIGADRCETLVEALQGAASAGPARGITLVGEDDREEHRSYRSLRDGALERAAALRDLGLRRGERVILVLNTSFELVEAFFGVMLAGGVPVPAYPPLAMSRMEGYQRLLAHIARTTRARLLVTDRTIGALLGTLYESCETLEAIVPVDKLRADATGFAPVSPGPDEPGFIQCTSGSTSEPKAVVLLHRNLVANLRGIARAFELRDEDVFVSWLPLYHDMGLIGALLGAVAQAIPLVLLSPCVFVMDPAAWWRAISRHGGTVTAAPNFAYGLSLRRLDEEELSRLDLRSLRIALCGAEPIQPEQVRRFAAALAPAGLDPRCFFPAYGLAESCVGVTLSRPGDGLRVDHVSREALSDAAGPVAIPAIGAGSVECVSVGRAILGTTVRVRGAAGEELPPRHVGEVWVEGPSVMAGYLDDEEATRRVIEGGALRTGDLGYLVGRELFIVGRVKNMLIVRGRNYYAEDIETAVEKVAGVRQGNAVAFGEYDGERGMDRLHVVAETRLRGAEELAGLEARIRDAVSEAVGLVPDEVRLLPPGTLPKTTSGKKQRQACRAALVAGVPLGLARRGRASRAVAALVHVVRSQIAAARHALRRAFSTQASPRASERLAANG